MGIKAKIALATCGILTLIGCISGGDSSHNNTNQNSQQEMQTVLEQAESASQSRVEPRIETKTEEVTEAIAFTNTTIEDSQLAKGQTRVVTEGVNVTKTLIYTVTYTDGVETSRELIETKVTKQPLNRVVAEGTYVAPAPAPATQPQQSTQCANGTYINSAGNRVCRPSNTNTGGATAICKDGTYSYSQSRRGTCSHHGGVREWL